MRQVSFKLIEYNIYDDNIITENTNKYRDNVNLWFKHLV